MRKMMIAGNWKMHLDVQAASLLVHRLDKDIKPHRDLEIVLAPSLLALQPVSLEIDRRKFRLAAQNAFHVDEGAYTGEVSFTMLRELVHYVIIGHSERRIYFGETLDMVRDKVGAAVRNKITPLLCVGETKHERVAGETRRVIHDQLTSAISNLTSEEVEDMVIAYEPVWAISTFGHELAKPDEIEQVFKMIRSEIKELYGAKAADSVRVLYGGSVDDQIAGGYLALPDCDGVLVGAASLNYKKFTGIVDSAYRLLHTKEK
ncbi:MAG TPA: triose-phosphate isomerase [Candidatus Saccharimonadales bacterium]|jgi:triosephosphate isomerase|nr:triose-phosphate isomerase [Candidatus Saccharimonadales bacterium]